MSDFVRIPDPSRTLRHFRFMQDYAARNFTDVGNADQVFFKPKALEDQVPSMSQFNL